MEVSQLPALPSPTLHDLGSVTPLLVVLEAKKLGMLCSSCSLRDYEFHEWWGVDERSVCSLLQKRRRAGIVDRGVVLVV